MRHWESNHNMEIHSITGISQKQEKVQINNLTLYLKELEKEQTKPKGSRRKNIINIRGSLAGVAQWIEHRPENQRVAGSIPSHKLQARSGPQLGVSKMRPHIDVSLPLFFPSPLPTNK